MRKPITDHICLHTEKISGFTAIFLVPLSKKTKLLCVTQVLESVYSQVWGISEGIETHSVHFSSHTRHKLGPRAASAFRGATCKAKSHCTQKPHVSFCSHGMISERASSDILQQRRFWERVPDAEHKQDSRRPDTITPSPPFPSRLSLRVSPFPPVQEGLVGCCAALCPPKQKGCSGRVTKQPNLEAASRSDRVLVPSRELAEKHCQSQQMFASPLLHFLFSNRSELFQ